MQAAQKRKSTGIKMCQVSFTSHNQYRPCLYQIHVGLVAVRESVFGKYRHNLNQAVRVGYKHPDNLGHNSFVDWVQVFVELVQVFVAQQRAVLHTDFF